MNTALTKRKQTSPAPLEKKLREQLLILRKPIETKTMKTEINDQMKLRFGAILFFLLLCTVFTPSATAQQSSEEAVRTKVEVLQLSPQTVKSYSTYIGHLKPLQRVNVSSEIPGIVEKLNTSAGQAVREDELLANIDTERQAINTKLNKSNYELALDDYRREKKLYEKNLSTEAKLTTLKNRLEVSRYRLELSKLDLLRSRVKSPISGIIKSKFIEEGEYIGGGRKMFEILDISKVIAVIHIPETDIRYLQVGKKASIILDALPGRHFVGYVKTIGLEADSRSRSFDVEIEIPNPEMQLLPGMLVRARMLKMSLNNQLVIPRHTIQENEKGSFVYIIKNGKIMKRQIRLGISVDESVQILSGLNFGDKLVETGQQLVTPLEAVDIINTRKQS